MLSDYNSVFSESYFMHSDYNSVFSESYFMHSDYYFVSTVRLHRLLLRFPDILFRLHS